MTSATFINRFDEVLDSTDLDVYQARVALLALADKCWQGDIAVIAPNTDWIESTQRQLIDCLNALSEIRTAGECITNCDREQRPTGRSRSRKKFAKIYQT